MNNYNSLNSEAHIIIKLIFINRTHADISAMC